MVALGSGCSLTHTLYTGGGELEIKHVITAVATDSHGHKSSDSVTITAGEPG